MQDLIEFLVLVMTSSSQTSAILQRCAEKTVDTMMKDDAWGEHVNFDELTVPCPLAVVLRFQSGTCFPS